MAYKIPKRRVSQKKERMLPVQEILIMQKPFDQSSQIRFKYLVYTRKPLMKKVGLSDQFHHLALFDQSFGVHFSAFVSMDTDLFESSFL